MRRPSIMTAFASLLILGLFLILRARAAYFTVDNDSSKLLSAGDAHAIIVVLELPPRESYNILVNFESRYGTKPAACFFSSVR